LVIQIPASPSKRTYGPWEFKPAGAGVSVMGTEVGCSLGVGEEISTAATGVPVSEGRTVCEALETWPQEETSNRKASAAAFSGNGICFTGLLLTRLRIFLAPNRIDEIIFTQ
jgi:hypothetical protein